jgi:hypothetical protein
MPSLNTGNAILSNPIKVDSSYNVGIGGAASGSYKLEVTGTAKVSDVLNAPQVKAIQEQQKQIEELKLKIK